MRASDLSELAAFDAVARHRSFRRAGEGRGVSIRLLNRTTRSVSLTDAGAMLLAQLSPAFVEIGEAVDALNQFRKTPFPPVPM
jgi:DNA-binding transcriptional LysR family regulator